MITKRVLIFLLCLFFSGNYTNFAKEKPAFKIGVISENEIWKDSVYLLGDITIEKNVTVQIKEGTIVYFSDYDLLKSGKDPHQCEININGHLDIQSSKKHPVIFESIKDGSTQVIDSTNEKTEIIEISPYVIDTKLLKDEFNAFKKEYFIVWGIIYALWLL
jgi:hypothetical protein